MAAFPLIPILAYTLIVSAVSYISVRIFKRFKISSDLFGFLRRKGRLSPFGIASHEHELLPTSTPSRLSNAAIGVYAGSSNVSILRSSSANLLPGSPPLLISPASSPPPNTPFRRAANRSLASFSLLEPTCRKPRRSRSLSVLISRPHDWSSRLSPSPPQQGMLDDDVMNRDWIPLAPVSRNITSASGTWSSRDTLAPAPVLNVSISAPVTPRPNPDLLGPLIDISPISPTSSDLHDSPLAIMSSSSSELAPPSYSSSSESDSYGPSGIDMTLSRSSDIGAQRIGGAAGFAYDWGFETKWRTAPHASEKQNVGGPPKVSPIFNGRFDAVDDASYIRCHEVRHPEGQDFDGIEQEKSPQVEMVFTGKPQKEHGAEPIPANNDPLPKSSELEASADIKNASEGTIIDPATFEGNFVTEIVVCDSNTENTLAKACQDPEPNLLSPPLITDKAVMGERPPVSIDTTQPPTLHKEGALLSAKKTLSPSSLQTPTPPASPPMMPMMIAISAGFGQFKPTVPTEPEHVLSVEKGEVDSEGMAQEDGDALNLPDNQEAGLNSTMAHAKEDVDVEQSEDAPTTPASSETSSPSSVRPAWSARAADAPPLGFSVARAATVEEEVAWPKAPKKKEAARELEPKESAAEKVSEEPAAQRAVAPIEDLDTTPVQGARDIVQAPVLKLTPSLPGSFPEESETVQKDMQVQVVSATSTAVAHTVVGSRTGRRRNLMTGLPIDVALAMQLRPGFGVGADPAWMVRFLMSVFGWFAIMIAGRGGDVDVYAL
ncbi:hypothetical protein JOM56_004056 [Amanita muscaria]